MSTEVNHILHSSQGGMVNEDNYSEQRSTPMIVSASRSTDQPAPETQVSYALMFRLFARTVVKSAGGDGKGRVCA